MIKCLYLVVVIDQSRCSNSPWGARTGGGEFDGVVDVAPHVVQQLPVNVHQNVLRPPPARHD